MMNRRDFMQLAAAGGGAVFFSALTRGALAVEAARRGAQVVAIDISPTLIALARERAPRDGNQADQHGREEEKGTERRGELARALTITASKFSGSAKAKIEKAGGRALTA